MPQPSFFGESSVGLPFTFDVPELIASEVAASAEHRRYPLFSDAGLFGSSVLLVDDDALVSAIAAMSGLPCR